MPNPTQPDKKQPIPPVKTAVPPVKTAPVQQPVKNVPAPPVPPVPPAKTVPAQRSEEHTSELQSPCISYAVFCLKKERVTFTVAFRLSIALSRLGTEHTSCPV